MNPVTAPNNTKEVIQDPLSALWEMKRITPSTRKGSTSFFTDCWTVRQVQLTDDILPDTPFPLHLDEEFPCPPIETTDSYAIWRILLSSCGRWLLLGTQRGWVYLYSRARGCPKGIFPDLPVGIFKAHEGAIVDLAWLPTIQNDEVPMFVSIGIDRRLCIWIGTSPYPIESVRTSEWTSSITLHPTDPTQLFLGSMDATVQLWRLQVSDCDDNVTARASMIDYVRVPDVVTAVSVSPDGQLLAVGVRRGSVAVYDSHSLRFMTEIECKGRKSRLWKTISHRIVGISWSKDSSSFVVTMHDNSLRLVNLCAGNNMADRSMIKLTGHSLENLLISATFLQSQDDSSRRILIGSEDRFMYCYEISPKEDFSENYHYDKVRVSKELMTSCVPTCCEFDKFLNDEIHNALTKQLGNVGSITNTYDDIITTNSSDNEEDKASDVNKVKSNIDRWRNPRYVGAIIGTLTGEFKIIVNFGIEG